MAAMVFSSQISPDCNASTQFELDRPENHGLEARLEAQQVCEQVCAPHCYQHLAAASFCC
jgi:hypothetical protein